MLGRFEIGQAEGIVLSGRVSADDAHDLHVIASRLLLEGVSDICIDLCAAEPDGDLRPVLERLHHLAGRTGGWLTVVSPPGPLCEPLPPLAIVPDRATALSLLA